VVTRSDGLLASQSLPRSPRVASVSGPARSVAIRSSHLAILSSFSWPENPEAGHRHRWPAFEVSGAESGRSARRSRRTRLRRSSTTVGPYFLREGDDPEDAPDPPPGPHAMAGFWSLGAPSSGSISALAAAGPPTTTSRGDTRSPAASPPAGAGTSPAGWSTTSTKARKVTLRNGEELQLDRAGDLGEGNAGMLIFIDGRELPEFVVDRHRAG
jgi:hypothetical protein